MGKEDDAADSKPSGAKALDESQLRTKTHDSISPTAHADEAQQPKLTAKAPLIKGFESAPPASTRVPESVARLSERGGSLSDSDRWMAAGALKKAVADGDDAAVEAALAKLPEVAQLAYRIAEVYSIATTGFSGPLLYARAGGAVEALLLEFEAGVKK